jgi:hypothetical protein
MVFHQTSIGKRKLANLNESNKTIPNSARRPASGNFILLVNSYLYINKRRIKNY